MLFSDNINFDCKHFQGRKMLYNYYSSRVFMHKEKGFICEKVSSFDLALIFNSIVARHTAVLGTNSNY